MTAVAETPPIDGPGGLWEALDLDAPVDLPGIPVVAIVGGGGKTALLYRLGREARALGRRAVLGGTARFTPAPHGEMPPVITASPGVLATAVTGGLIETPLVVATTGHVSKGRLAAIDPETADELAWVEFRHGRQRIWRDNCGSAGNGISARHDGQILVDVEPLTLPYER